jgi:hypothetical protein
MGTREACLRGRQPALIVSSHYLYAGIRNYAGTRNRTQFVISTGAQRSGEICGSYNHSWVPHVHLLGHGISTDLDEQCGSEKKTPALPPRAINLANN